MLALWVICISFFFFLKYPEDVILTFVMRKNETFFVNARSAEKTISCFVFLGSHVFLRGIEIEMSQLLEIKCRVFKSDRKKCLCKILLLCMYKQKSEDILM